ncbi:MAG: hypothetical protein SGBAC_008102 [Bacillariaceae sp.]
MKTVPPISTNSADTVNNAIPNSNPSTPVVVTNAAARPVSPEQLQQEQHRANNAVEEKETFGQKMSRISKNCWESTGLCCFTAKEQSQIAALEFQLVQRQKKFGVDYLAMVLTARQQQLNSPENAPPQAPIAEALERCVSEAVSDIDVLQSQIDSRMVNIDQRTVEVNQRIQPGPGTPKPAPAAAAVILIDEGLAPLPPQEAPPPAPPAAAFVAVPNEDDGNHPLSGKASYGDTPPPKAASVAPSSMTAVTADATHATAPLSVTPSSAAAVASDTTAPETAFKEENETVATTM